MRTVIHTVTIITMNENRETINGYVIVHQSVFEKVSPGFPSKEELEEADQVINGKHKWLMPGLINTHNHLGSTLLRGAGDDMPLMEWLRQVMWPNESQFDKQMVMTAAQVGMMEMVKSGTTSFLDMYHLHMPDIAELILDKGLRATLCRGMIGLCSVQEQEDKLAESVNLFQDYHGEGDGRLSVALSPHAPYTCPPPFMARIAEEADRHGMMIHTHLAETREEVEKHINEHGQHPVSHMAELGLFNGRSLIAHAVHAGEAETNILAEYDVAISHNPVSNLKLGSGIAPVTEFLAKGMTVGLGTDSAASNNNLDMFEEMRTAALVHKGYLENPAATNAPDILAMATYEGAKALGLSHIGRIQPGYRADFILLDSRQLHLIPDTEARIKSHLVYSAKGSDVTDVYIDGKAILENQQFVSFDEEKIVAEANDLAKNMISR